MTTSISMPAKPFAITECDFVTLARNDYDAADALVKVIDKHKKAQKATRRANMDSLRAYIQSVENNLWEALARDYPKFRFRRQNQTIVISYNNSGQSVSISSGEVNKIRGWGVNDYYEALDTVNRLQNSMYNNGMEFNRRWKDDWDRLGHQLVIVDRRNCKGFVEPTPGPIQITPPVTTPMPPNPPGPEIPRWPLPPIAAQGNWSTYDTRNWSILGWTNSQIIPMADNLQTNRPSIVHLGSRDLIYFAPNGINTTKLVWLFHGTGESAYSWFTNYEKLKYVKKLTDAGFAVAAYECRNRISRKWTLTSNSNTNHEIIDMISCQNFLAQAGILKRVCTAVSMINPQTGQVTVEQTCGWTTPQYGVGMSSGATLLSSAAKVLSISKIILHNASGVSQIIRNADYNIKTLWMLSENDNSAVAVEATANFNYLNTNKPSLGSAIYTQTASKITSTIFDEIPNVGSQISSDIIAGLIASGFITSEGVVTTKYSSADKATRQTYMQNTIPAIVATAFGNDVTNYRLYIGDILEQLRISFSDYEFSGWQRQADGTLTDRDLAFLQA